MNLPKQLRAVRVYSFTSCLRLTDAVWVALLAARGFTLAQIGLAEQRKGIAGVHRDQPGHADSAGGGKQSVQPRQLHGPAHRDGQREQRRADEDEHRKAKGDGARRGLLFCDFFEVFHIFTCDS